MATSSNLTPLKTDNNTLIRKQHHPDIPKKQTDNNSLIWKQRHSERGLGQGFAFHLFDVANGDDDDEDDGFVRKSFSDDVNDDYDDGLHIMTQEEAERYYDKMIESEGFDLIEYPANYIGRGKIQPSPLEGYLEGYEHYSKLALEQFSKNENANFQFEKIVKVNSEPANPVNLYITFEAKDAAAADGVINTFQTKVCMVLPLTNTFVDFVRLKPGSSK